MGRRGRDAGRGQAGGVVWVVNGVLLGVGGVFLTTASALVTAIAAGAAVVVGVTVALVFGR